MRRIATLMTAGVLAALLAPGSASAFFGPTGSFGGSGSGNGQFNGPRGVAATGATVYVADTANNRVEYFDTSGNFQGSLASSPTAPTDVAVAGNSQFAAGSSGVVHWTLGLPLNAWAPPGTSYGVAIDPGGNNFYVSDRQNGIIRKYDGAGNLLGTVGSQGAGAGQLLHPEGMTTDAAGNIYVADPGNNKVVKYTGSGFQEFPMPTLTLYENGTPVAAQLQPHDVAVDASGRVFIADGNPQTNLVAMFGPGGDLEEAFGSLATDPGSACPLSTPYGVSTSPSGTLYVASTGENLIRTYSEAVGGCPAPYAGAPPAAGSGSGNGANGNGNGGSAGKKGKRGQPAISFTGMPRHCAKHNFQFKIQLTDDVEINNFKLFVNGRKASRQNPASTDWSVKVSMPVNTVRRQLPKGTKVKVSIRVKAHDVAGRKSDRTRSFKICG
jgi:SMP-30/gluconolaconase/LRE-like protein